MEAKAIDSLRQLKRQTKEAEVSSMEFERVQSAKAMSLIDGRFQLHKHLAKGGFGDVYQALDLQTTQLVVLKTIRHEQKSDERAPVRFLREIRATQKLASLTPHIVRFVSQGRDPLRGDYYAMEHLEGQTLRQLIDNKAPMNVETTLHIIRQLCQALLIAHQEGIVHRDLKPDNIFLVERNGDPYFVKLLDFGLAKNLAGTYNKDLTVGMLGSPRYMAPEQGYTANIDHRADQYALGLIAYELLTQNHAVKGHTFKEVLDAQFNKQPPSLKECCPDRSFPKGLEDTIFRAIEKQPDHRFQSLSSFWRELAMHAPADAPSLEFDPSFLPQRERELTTAELRAVQQLDTMDLCNELPQETHATSQPKSTKGIIIKRTLLCLALISAGFVLGMYGF